MTAATIAYYISDYGFGHAARSIAVIRALLQRSRILDRLIVCSSERILSFVQASIGEQQADVFYRECASDLGYVLKPETIEPDIEIFKRKYNHYIQSMPMEVGREADFLRTEQVGLVIADISPIAINAAHEAGAASVGVSNFTWYTAYQAMLDESLLAPLYEAYARMDYYIGLQGVDEPDWGVHGSMQAGFFSREVDWSEANAIRKAINPDNNKTIVYCGIGMSIFLHDLMSWKLWDDPSLQFIVSSNMKVQRPNVIAIPSSYTESQNYVAASDIVISKPGWSTVSEAVVLNKPLILLTRHTMKEDENTIRSLPEQLPLYMADWEQLRTGEVHQEISSMHIQKHRSESNETIRIASYLEQIVRGVEQ